MTSGTDPLLSTIDGSSNGFIRASWGPLGAPAFAVVQSVLVDGSFNDEMPYVPCRRSSSRQWALRRIAASFHYTLSFKRLSLSSSSCKSLFPCPMAYRSRSMLFILIDHSVSPLALRGLCLKIMTRAITEWIFLTLKWLESFCQDLSYIIEVRAKRAQDVPKHILRFFAALKMNMMTRSSRYRRGLCTCSCISQTCQ